MDDIDLIIIIDGLERLYKMFKPDNKTVSLYKTYTSISFEYSNMARRGITIKELRLNFLTYPFSCVDFPIIIRSKKEIANKVHSLFEYIDKNAPHLLFDSYETLLLCIQQELIDVI